MLTEEKYTPARDHDGFITKSVMKLLGLLAAFRSSAMSGTHAPGGTMKLIFTLLAIILSAVSRNMLFSYVLLAALFVRLIFVDGRALGRIIRSALFAALLSMLILLPSVFMGSPRTMLTISLKVFISIGLISLFSATTPWNQITAALKLFHLPDTFIFVFDITLKYIAVLGELCCDMLTALSLRSVGRNKHKGHALSGIPGVTFLKSREMADAMYEAMECRGFTGEYKKPRRNPFGKNDLPLAAASAALILLFIYAQGAI